MFIRYAKSVRENYPTSIAPPLFLGLAHKSIGEDFEAEKNINEAKEIYNKGHNKLVDLFGLKYVLEEFSKTKEGARGILEDLQKKYEKYGE